LAAETNSEDNLAQGIRFDPARLERIERWLQLLGEDTFRVTRTSVDKLLNGSASLRDLFKITRFPKAVERWRVGSKKVQIDEPALTRVRLDPLPLFAGRRAGPEIEFG
jgi:hypothetical protein